jgi:hypothetical protein
MPNPLTHLIWGYFIARGFSKDPRYLAIGMLFAICLDFDYLIPGVAHHGWIHTPVFVLGLSGVIWLVSRDKLLSVLALSIMMSHLVFDTIATQDPIMWLWPVSTEAYAIWTISDLAALAVIKVYLLLIPVMWIWENWKRTGESPIAVFHWLDARIPRPVLYGTAASAGALLVFVWFNDYMWMLTA